MMDFIKKLKYLYLILLSIIITSCVEVPQGYYYETKKYDGTVIIDTLAAKNYKNIVEKTVDSTNSDGSISHFYFEDGILLTKYSTNGDNFVGDFIRYHKNGKIKYQEHYNDKGRLDGEVFSYEEEGKVLRKEIFKDSTRIEGKCFDSKGREISFFEMQQEPNVDLDDLIKNIVYPEKIRRKNGEERIILRCLIGADGKVIMIKYDRGHSKEIVNNSIKSILKVKFIPGYFEGKPETMWVNIPISFRLR